MINTKINYYSHLLLNSKYSLIIKLALILFIYSIFYLGNINDIAHCTNEELESLKERIRNYRLNHEEGFLTAEEQEAPRHVTRTGTIRPGVRLGPEFNQLTKYEDVTDNFSIQDYINVYGAEGFTLSGRKHADETGKEIAKLYKTYYFNVNNWDGTCRFRQTNSWFCYDYKEYYQEVFYPANHPDNNFDPQCKRLHRIVGYKFYEKQLSEKAVDAFNQNCSIS